VLPYLDILARGTHVVTVVGYAAATDDPRDEPLRVFRWSTRIEHPRIADRNVPDMPARGGPYTDRFALAEAIG
jgi:hypothetical protein